MGIPIPRKMIFILRQDPDVWKYLIIDLLCLRSIMLMADPFRFGGNFDLLLP